MKVRPKYIKNKALLTITEDMVRDQQHVYNDRHRLINLLPNIILMVTIIKSIDH